MKLPAGQETQLAAGAVSAALQGLKEQQQGLLHSRVEAQVLAALPSVVSSIAAIIRCACTVSQPVSSGRSWGIVGTCSRLIPACVPTAQAGPDQAPVHHHRP